MSKQSPISTEPEGEFVSGIKETTPSAQPQEKSGTEELKLLAEISPSIQKVLDNFNSTNLGKKEFLLAANDLVVRELEKNPENARDLEVFKEKIARLLRKEMGFTPEQEKLQSEREAFDKRLAGAAAKLGVSTEDFREDYAHEENAAREANPEELPTLYETGTGSKTVERLISESVTTKIKAGTDSLTGINNRAAFDQEVERRRKEVKGRGEFSMIMIDIDHFKKVNDTYGHAAGDYVLKEVAQTLKKNMRKGDSLARYGGEEMVIMAPNANGDAPGFAERLRKEIENKKMVFEDQEIKVTISAGVSPYDESFEEMKKRSDVGLYLSKGADIKLQEGISVEKGHEGDPNRNQVWYFKDGQYRKHKIPDKK